MRKNAARDVVERIKPLKTRNRSGSIRMPRATTVILFTTKLMVPFAMLMEKAEIMSPNQKAWKK